MFDNAEEPSGLTRFLPGGDARVLITSRCPDWQGVATQVEVALFSPPESAALLRARVAGLGDADARRLGEALGHLPLALDQAAALLAEGGLTVDSYLNLLETRAAELLHHDFSDENTAGGRLSVAASWSVAFDALAARDPAGLQLLTLLAWLAPEPVPLTLITDHPELLPEPLSSVAADPLALARTLRNLKRRALAQVGTDSVLLHRIPAALLRGHVHEGEHVPEPASGWPATALLLLRRAVPVDAWNNPTVWPAWHRLLPHVLTVTAPDRAGHLDATKGDLTKLLDRTASYLLTRGQPREAVDLAQRAYDLRRIHYDDEDLDTLNCAHNLALAFRQMGKYALARELDQETFDRRRRLFGDDHSGTLNAAQSLALDLTALGEHTQARELDEDTLRRRRRIFGVDAPKTLASAHNLAISLAKVGQREQARKLNEETLDRRRRVLGDDHPDTLRSATCLAADLWYLGKYAEARQLNEDTLDRLRRVLGDDHPDTLLSVNNLAYDLRKLGDYRRARELDESTLDRRRRVLGDDHPDTLVSARHLALDLRNLGEPDKARALDEWVAEREAASEPREDGTGR